MSLLLPLLLAGCPSPCVGAGCGEEFSAALVGVLTTLDNLNQPPDSPRQTPITIIGDTEQGPDWSLSVASGVLMVGSPGADAVYSFPASLSGVYTTDDAAGTLTGPAGTGFGSALARANADLLVGAYLTDRQSITRQEGAVYVLPDRAAGFTDEAGAAASAGLVVYGEEPAGRFGEVLAACADIDGDGLDDWAAAGTWDSSNQPLSGLVALSLSSEPPAGASATARELSGFWLGAQDGARAGTALACDHDLTGDGTVDLLIGAPFADEGAQEAGGAIYVVPGPTADAPLASGPLLASVYRTVSGLTDEAWLGWSLATGDLNADGVAELVAGAPGASGGAGEVFIWDGAAFQAGDDRPLIRIRGTEAGDGLGRTVLLADLDDDGDDDLVVGAPHHNPLGDDQTAFFSGALYIFAGAPGYQGWLPLRGASDAEVTLTLAQQYLQTGQAVVSGDFDADGSPDLGLLHSTAPE